MERLKFDLDFRELEDNENLYDDVNLDRYYVVDAEYLRRGGYEDSPDVCAIPRTPTIADIMNVSSVYIHNYDYSAVKSMRKYEKLEAIEELDHVMVPLSVHLEVAANINKLLLESYKNRNVMFSSSGGDSILEKHGFLCNILSLRSDTAPRPTGFFLHGKTGCGKTMAVQLACRMYPKAIRHTFEDFSYTQIPIIRVTALQKQMSDVYRSIATQLDEILDMGDFHESKVRSATMTKTEGYIKKWIKMYHIGLIIIDEIQFLNISEAAKGIEDIIGITQDTGCNFGFIGNEDAREKIFGVKRLFSRLNRNLINADTVTDNSKKLFENAMETLWYYQWTSSYTPLDEEIKEQLFYETSMNIALLKYIIIKVQSEAVASGRRGPINVDYIKKQTDSDLKKLRDLITDPTERKEREYQEYMARLHARIALQAADDKEESRKTLMEAIERGKLTRTQATIRDRVVQSILDTTEYSESQIYRVVMKVLDAEPSLISQPPKFLTMRTLESLKEAETKKKRKNSRKNVQTTKELTTAKEKDEQTKKVLALLGVTG